MSIVVDRINQIAHAYRDAQILFSGLRLGVFDALDKGAQTAGDLARELNVDQRGIRILCDALAALELLNKTDEGSYCNLPDAAAMLLADSPTSQREILLHNAGLYQRWAGLTQVVRSGIPVPPEVVEPELRRNPESFARAMADVGRQSAAATAEMLELGEVRDLLDAGGGPGVYALEFARRNPQLQALVFDTAETLRETQRNISRAGMENQVRTQAGNLLEDDFGGPYDLVFVSNVLHCFSAEHCRSLISRAVRVLRPGGQLCVKDFIPDPKRKKPQGALLFAVNMLVNTPGGDTYTSAQLRLWFEEAGLHGVRQIPLTAQSSLMLGRTDS